MVVAMARNGVNFGVRLAGTGERWFEAPANPIDGLYFPGYSVADAAPDLGDSAITETAGVGGFAMAAAPAIVKFVGGTSADATHHSLRMRAITLGSIALVHAALARLRARGRGHRRAQGRRFRHPARDQQRHRAPAGRRRTDRRRRHVCADGVLRRGGARRWRAGIGGGRIVSAQRRLRWSPSAATRSSATRSTLRSRTSTTPSARRRRTSST